MRRRVLGAILTITTVAVLLFGVPLAFIVSQMVDEQAVLRLQRQAVLAASGVPDDFAAGDDPVELPATDGVDYGLYGPDGVLVAGAGPATGDRLTRQALANAVVDGEIAETLVVAVPVVGNETVTGAIRAQQATTIIDRRSERILALLATLAVTVIGIAAALGYVLAGRLTRPIRVLRDATVRLGTGDFAIDTPHNTIPELADTAAALAATARRLDDLVTRERAFSADASHQLRTPLTAMRATVETELVFPRPDPSDALRETLADINRLETTITELLTLARTANQPTAIDLASVLAPIAAAWQPRYQAASRTLTIAHAHYQPRPLGHPTMLSHALDVLLDNALTHGLGATTIEITHTEDTVTLTITDQGDGFPTTTPPTPLTPNTYEPHGHGLPLAHRLISAMHGRLTITQPGPNPRIDIILRRPTT